MIRWNRRGQPGRWPDPAPAQTDALYAIALEEARRGVDQQRDDLKSVRDRTLALLGIATVTASVAAGLSASDEIRSPSWLDYAAAACVISLVGVTLYVSWPRTTRFTVDPTVVIAWGKDGASETVVRSHLARWLENDYDKNRQVINELLVAFRIGVGLLALEIVLLLWNLWG